MRAPTAAALASAALASAVLACVLLWQPLAAQQSATTVIRDVAVIDVRDGSVAPHRSVVIRDGRIAAVTPAGDAAGDATVPAGAQVVDGAGKYLMPGLADMHVHFGRGGGSRTVRRAWSACCGSTCTTASRRC